MKHTKISLIFLLPPLLFLLLCVLMPAERTDSLPISSESASRRDHPAGIDELKLDLNAAELDELCCLPGIGETTARRILAYRERTGGFRSLEELDQIEGIGTARLAILRDYLYVEGTT